MQLSQQLRAVNFQKEMEFANAQLDASDGCEASSSGKHLGRSFFDQPCEELARALLGKLIVRKSSNLATQTARIVETEAYPGGDDKPSHSYGGRRTARNAAMFMSPGTMNVYNIYGVLQCINVSNRGAGAAVLIRAAEPLDGVDVMLQRRNAKMQKLAITKRGVCNGPSKLCQALAITKAEFDQVDSTTSDDLFFADDSYEVNPEEVVAKGRIGISAHGEEFASLPLRFYIRGSLYISVK